LADNRTLEFHFHIRSICAAVPAAPGTVSGLYSFPLNGPLRRIYDCFDIETVFFQQFQRLSAFAEAVIDGHHLEWRWVEPGEHLGHRASEASVHLVFLASNPASGFPYRVEYGLGIQRFDRVDVDHFRADPHIGEFFFRLDGEPNQMAACEQGYVFPFDHGIGLSYGEGPVRSEEHT